MKDEGEDEEDDDKVKEEEEKADGRRRRRRKGDWGDGSMGMDVGWDLVGSLSGASWRQL